MKRLLDKKNLAKLVTLSVMTGTMFSVAGNVWAGTMDVTAADGLNAALLNPDCDIITIDAGGVGQEYDSARYDTAIQLSDGALTAVKAMTIQGNGYVLYDFLGRDIGWNGKDAENVLTLDNVKIYASTCNSVTLKNLVIQNGKNNDSKSFHLLTSGSYLNKSSSDCPVLYISSGGFTVAAENVQFLNNLNTNTNGGGALSTSNNNKYITGSKLDFKNVTFKGNLATYYGGAMQIAGTDVLNLQGVFEDNHAGSHGGAVNIDLGSQVSNFGGVFIANTSGYKIVDGSLDLNTIGDGNGGAIAVRGNPAGTTSDQVMHITMTDDSVFKGNKVANYSNSTYLTGAGGAIYNGGGVFTVNKATFGGTEDGDGNEARVGGALGNSSYANSEGIFRGQFTVSNSSFIKNVAYERGGAVFNGGPVYYYFSNPPMDGKPAGRYDISASVTVTNSEFRGNSVSSDTGLGGAVYSFGSMIISGSTFTENKAAKGGAVYNATNPDGNPALFTRENKISDTSFTNNTATTAGGAIYNEADCSLTLTNVTFSGNTAAGEPNDIYNAGTLILNNVKFEDISVTTVVNAATGNITIGADTRVTAATIDNMATAANLTIAGGTLVTTQEKRITDDDKFTMTNGVIELTNDYKLADINSIQTAVGSDYGQGNFKLKFTGNVIQEQGEPLEPVNLETLIENKIELAKAPVKAESLVTGEGDQKQLKIGGDSDKIKDSLAVGSIDVGEAKKLVIAPVNVGQPDEKEIVLEFGNSDISGPLLVTKNNEKVDVELTEGAKIVVADKQKLEIANLDAKNNGDKHVTLAGEIAAEKFNVAVPQNPDADIICFNVGSDEQKGSLSAAEVNMNGAMVFADPVWADDITQASAYSQGGTTINGKLVGGRNSVISVGTTDRTVAERIFKDMESQLSFGNGGDVNAVLYVAKAQNMAATGAIRIDGSLTEKPEAPADKSFTVAARSLTMVEAAAAGDTGAISGLTSASVDPGAKLYIVNANADKEYTILKGTNIAGWTEGNITANGLIDSISITSGDNTCFKIKTGGLAFSVDNTVMSNVGQAITEDVGSRAFKTLFALVDTPSKVQQRNNVNALANMGENLNVTAGAADMVNMMGDSIAEHWQNAPTQETAELRNTANNGENYIADTVEQGKAKEIMPARIEENDGGKYVWASYIHNKNKVDGMKLGGMEGKYNAQYNGTIVGVDLTKDFGVALTYADGNITNGFAGHNDAKYYGGSIYGRKVLGKVNLYGDITYTHAKNELQQNSVTADAKTDTVSVGLTAKYLAKACKTGNVAPFVGVRYIRIDGKEYTDSLGISREADKINSVVVPLGLEYSGEFVMPGSVWTWRPTVAVGFMFNFGDRDNDMTMKYNGATDTFGHDFVDKHTFFTRVGMEFVKKNFTLGVGYNFMKSSSSRNDKWNVNLKFSF